GEKEVHRHVVDERTVEGLFPSESGAGDGGEWVQVYMIPTPAEKYAYTDRDRYSSPRSFSSSSSSDAEGTLANTSLPYSDISASPTINTPPSPKVLPPAKRLPDTTTTETFPSIYPSLDIFTAPSTHESRREEFRKRMIELFAARTRQIGPTCDDVDRAEYSDEGCETESDEGGYGGGKGWADDELTEDSRSDEVLYEEPVDCD
ncbi:unnamed protein product, partial [Peniophora sp. CBMAI 1063]